MRRDTKAFLVDVIEAADAILIGEALTNLSRLNPELFSRIENAPRIISFRNKLTHEYVKVDNTLIWGVIQSHLQPLRSACVALASDSGTGGVR